MSSSTLTQSHLSPLNQEHFHKPRARLYVFTLLLLTWKKSLTISKELKSMLVMPHPAMKTQMLTKPVRTPMHRIWLRLLTRSKGSRG